MAKVPPSLPVKQRPFSSIAILGDSITSANYDWNTAGAPNYCYFADNGYLTHAQGLSGVEFNFLVDAGIGGNKTADMLARVYTDIIAYQPDVCIVMGGTNDANSVSVTQAIANIQGICSALRAANIAVILASPPAYSSATATQYKFLAALRRKIEAYAHATQGIWYWDVYGCTVNPTSSTGAYLSNYSDDNVHPNNLGAYKMGVTLAPILSQLFQTRALVCTVLDVKSSNTDSNQLIANPLMTGSRSVSGTGYSGTLPTAWNGLTPTNQATGAATVYTAGSAANGGIGNKITMACTGSTSASSIHYCFTDDFSSSVVDNNSMQAAARLKITAATSLRSVMLKLTRNAGSGKATSVYWSYISSKSQNIAAGIEYPAAITPPFKFVPGGSINLWLQVEVAANGSATVEIEQAEVRDIGTAYGQTDNEIGS